MKNTTNTAAALALLTTSTVSFYSEAKGLNPVTVYGWRLVGATVLVVSCDSAGVVTSATFTTAQASKQTSKPAAIAKAVFDTNGTARWNAGAIVVSHDRAHEIHWANKCEAQRASGDPVKMASYPARTRALLEVTRPVTP